jgi:hypothetical protein
MLAAGGGAAVAGRTTRPRCAGHHPRARRLTAADGSYRVANEWHVVIARA